MNLLDEDEIDSAWESDVLPCLFEYVGIPCLSPAFDPEWEAGGHLDRAAHLLVDWCESRTISGIESEVVKIEGRTPAVVVDIPGTTKSPSTVLIYGHLDKQPPLDGWRVGLLPFAPSREGDYLYGRGTADDGYALFSGIVAIEALINESRDRPRTVILIEGSEESGSPDLNTYLTALDAQIGQPQLVVCLDSGCLDYTRLWYTSSLRGNLVATLRAQVLREGVHSGLAGGVVPSSFRILRALLSRIEDEATGDILPDFLKNVVDEDQRAKLEERYAAVDRDYGSDSLRLPVMPGLMLSSHPLLKRALAPSLSVIGIDGIPSSAIAGNVLRPFTEAKLSLRLPPSVLSARAADSLVDLLTTDPPAGATVTVEIESAADGWVAPDMEPWVMEALQRASSASFGKPPGSYGEGGTIPFLATLGRQFPDAQVVALGVLGPGNNAHGPNEALHLPMAKAVTRAVSELLAAAQLSRP